MTGSSQHFGIRIAPLAMGIVLAAWPAASFADTFVRLRFYPGETLAEDRPSRPNPVTLAFNGKVFEPALRFSAESSGDEPLAPDEEFVREVIRANRQGSAEEILALWDPAERLEIQSDLGDPKMFDRNRLFYQKIEVSALVAKILYGPYILFFVQHSNEMVGEMVYPYPVRETATGFVLTNALHDDPMVEVFLRVVREQLSSRENPESNGASGQNAE